MRTSDKAQFAFASMMAGFMLAIFLLALASYNGKRFDVLCPEVRTTP